MTNFINKIMNELTSEFMNDFTNKFTIFQKKLAEECDKKIEESTKLIKKLEKELTEQLIDNKNLKKTEAEIMTTLTQLNTDNKELIISNNKLTNDNIKLTNEIDTLKNHIKILNNVVNSQKILHENYLNKSENNKLSENNKKSNSKIIDDYIVEDEKKLINKIKGKQIKDLFEITLKDIAIVPKDVFVRNYFAKDIPYVDFLCSDGDVKKLLICNDEPEKNTPLYSYLYKYKDELVKKCKIWYRPNNDIEKVSENFGKDTIFVSETYKKFFIHKYINHDSTLISMVPLKEIHIVQLKYIEKFLNKKYCKSSNGPLLIRPLQKIFIE